MWQDNREFKERASYWADKIGVEPRSITIRPMKHKWASCSSKGRIIFNARLIELDKELGDYVMVHELLHMVVPNHGKLWKSLMRAHVENYEELDAKLRQCATVLPSASW